MAYYLGLQALLWLLLSVLFLRAQETPHYREAMNRPEERRWHLLIASTLLIQSAWPAYLLYASVR
jgi:hypothetical protein